MQQFNPSGPRKFPENPQPAIRFRQGKRTVILIVPTLDQVGHLAAPLDTKEDPEAVYDLLDEPEADGRVGRNRLRNNGHMKGIAKYLGENEKWVLGSLVTVARPNTIRYTPELEFDADRSIGYVEIGKYEAIVEVTDGGHRVGGVNQAVADRRNPHWLDMVKSGLPVMIVEEEDHGQAGQDFVSLAQTRPIPSSLRDALDTKSPVNRFFLALSRELEFTSKGERIEYMSNSVGANSDKLLPFYGFKFVGSQLIIGRRFRSPKPQEEAINQLLAGDGDEALWHSRVRHVYDYASHRLPGWKQISEGMSVADARKEYISISSVGMTAFMLALHEVIDQGEAVVEKAIDRLASLNWSRSEDSVLFGTVITRDQADSTKLVTSISRTGFEAGADELIKHLGTLVAAAA